MGSLQRSLVHNQDGIHKAMTPLTYFKIAGYVAVLFIGLIGGWNLHHPKTIEVKVPVKTETSCPTVKAPKLSALDIAILNWQNSHQTEIKLFQRSQGLTPDGVIGPSTFLAVIKKF